METLEKEWTVYPVLHIDFSISKYVVASSYAHTLIIKLAIWEKVYGKSEEEGTYSLRFSGIIRRAYEQTGKRVVILIDEYDSPMLDKQQ